MSQRTRLVRWLSLFALFFTLWTSPVAAQERIGVGLDLWIERSEMAGEQLINASRLDESFDYGALGGAASAWLLFQAKERVRAGPGIRLYGNYGATGNPNYIFGFLTEAFMMGEYALPAFERFDAIFGGRAGVAVLFPGGDFADEIRFRQAEGVGVWSLPRLGGLLGVNFGLRRKMAGKFWLRGDVLGQYERIFLFATDEIVDELRFQKRWSTHTVRVGLLLGAEIAL